MLTLAVGPEPPPPVPAAPLATVHQTLNEVPPVKVVTLIRKYPLSAHTTFPLNGVVRGVHESSTSQYSFAPKVGENSMLMTMLLNGPTTASRPKRKEPGSP